LDDIEAKFCHIYSNRQGHARIELTLTTWSS